jgi:NAD(P)-dependent dehydrogenase (short-subunit alcohol dehydrogenase family)
MPSQDERIFPVTGGAGGTVYESAKALVAGGADVVIAACDAQRGEQAIAGIRKATPLLSPPAIELTDNPR